LLPGGPLQCLAARQGGRPLGGLRQRVSPTHPAAAFPPTTLVGPPPAFLGPLSVARRRMAGDATGSGRRTVFLRSRSCVACRSSLELGRVDLEAGDQVAGSRDRGGDGGIPEGLLRQRLVASGRRCAEAAAR